MPFLERLDAKQKARFEPTESFVDPQPFCEPPTPEKHVLDSVKSKWSKKGIFSLKYK